MKNLTILVDMDDVMIDLLYPWTRWLNERYKMYVKISDIKSWDMKKAYSGLKMQQILEPLSIPEFWDGVAPISGSVETLKKIIDDGDEVYVVTNSHHTTIDSKIEKVLNKYYPFIPLDNVIVAKKKQMIVGDVLIDDAIHNLKNGRYQKILMNMPYNYDYNENDIGAVRVYNWDDIYRNIKALRRTL